MKILIYKRSLEKLNANSFFLEIKFLDTHLHDWQYSVHKSTYFLLLVFFD